MIIYIYMYICNVWNCIDIYIYIHIYIYRYTLYRQDSTDTGGCGFTTHWKGPMETLEPISDPNNVSVPGVANDRGKTRKTHENKQIYVILCTRMYSYLIYITYTMYVHTWIYIYIYIYMYVTFMYILICFFSRYMHACTHIYIHTDRHTHIHMYVYTLGDVQLTFFIMFHH